MGCAVKIGGGKTKGAAAPISGDDDSVDIVIAREKLRGAPDCAFTQVTADARRRNALATAGDRVDGVHGEPEALTQRLEPIHIPFGAVTETEVGSHHDMPCRELA